MNAHENDELVKSTQKAIICKTCGHPATQIFGAINMCTNCTKVGRENYHHRLVVMNREHTFTVESIGGACPTQAEGRTAGGRPYYFRARHGGWALHLGEPGWGPYTSWPDRPRLGDEHVIAEGEDPSGGFMDDEDVLAILDEHLEGK